MRHYKYKKIDAFTSEKSSGNPAACFYLEDGETLTNEEMLAIAKQHEGFVSEVVFCSHKNGAGYTLLYYSSECEVEFCGHGTVACMYSLIKNSPDLLAKKQVQISTGKKGALTVYNEIPGEDAIYITAPDPIYIETVPDAHAIASALGIESEDISDSLPAGIIDAGLKTLIAPVISLRQEITMSPDKAILEKFCIANDIDIILVFSKETDDSSAFAHIRVFAPKFGYLEDPATGSGNSAFGYYMLKNMIWDGSNISIEQGRAGTVFNIVKLASKSHRVLFGGNAITRIEGEYIV